MEDIYYCYDCARYFTEDEMADKRVCLEEEYGVAGDFHTKTYANVSCCPYCKSTDYQIEDDTDEIVEILNSYSQYNVGKVKEKIKQLEKYKLAVDFLKSNLDLKVYCNEPNKLYVAYNEIDVTDEEVELLKEVSGNEKED